ncbi:MAG: FHA domain-containing protein [Pseudomonadota bacterium]|nr:FHA domain-containing protein [Pseudomonadota bacterium]
MTLMEAKDLLADDAVASERRGGVGTPEPERDDGWRLRGVSPEVSGAQFLVSELAVVGRNRSSDLVLETPQVSRRHAELRVIDGGLSLRDLGSTNGTYVNGDKMSEAVLHSGDLVRFDVVEFEILGPDAESDQTVSRVAPAELRRAVADHERGRLTEPRIVMRTGPLAGRKFPLLKASYDIGRGVDNDIVVDDPSVSRRHARFFSDAGVWNVQDLGSTNGVRINGEPVKRARLYDGDRVRLGKVRIKFETPDPHGDVVPLAAPSRRKLLGAARRVMRLPRVTGVGFGGVLALLVIGSVGYISYVGHDPEPPLTGTSGLPSGPAVDAALQVVDTWHRPLTDNRRHPASPALADINGDGWLDILVADAAGYLTALDGEEGKRIFEADLAGRVVAPVVVADLGGDGRSDIVVASYEGVVYAINGKAQLLWRSRLDRDLGNIVSAPLLRDLNGDGIADVIVPTSQRGLVALDGARGWEIWSSSQVGLRNALTAPVAADLDGDGQAELITTADDGSVWALASRGGRVWKRWSRSMPSPIYAAAAVTTGPKPLVVVATEMHGVFALFGQSGLVAWRVEGDRPYLANPVVVTPPGAPERVVSVSVDGDVIALDAATGTQLWQRALHQEVQSNPVVVSLDDGGGQLLVLLGMAGAMTLIDSATGQTLLDAELLADSTVTAGATAGDVNRDGLVDLVVPWDNGRVSVFTLNRRVPAGSLVWPEFAGPVRRFGGPGG